jgi:hypothetical protein
VGGVPLDIDHVVDVDGDVLWGDVLTVHRLAGVLGELVVRGLPDPDADVCADAAGFLEEVELAVREVVVGVDGWPDSVLLGGGK